MIPKALLEKLYDEMLCRSSAPGLRIKPPDSITVDDLNEWELGRPLPGGCGLDFTCGGAVVSLRNNVLKNLCSVQRVEGQSLRFAQDGSTVRIPLAFSSLILTGELMATQHCQDYRKEIYTKTYTGKYSVTLTGVVVSASVTFDQEAGCGVTVQSMDLEVADISIDGTANELPPNLEKWWLLLANSKRVVNRLKAALVDERARAFGAKWTESAINRQLARLYLAEPGYGSIRREQ